MERVDASSTLPVGSSGEPLLLLPGTLCDERVFAPTIAWLARSSVAYMGLPRLESVRAMAQEVLRLAPRQFALAGLSRGGIVALHVALLAPERVAGLALIATNARAVPAAQRASRRAEVAEARGRLGDFARTVLAPLYAGDGSGDNAFTDLVADMAEGMGDRVFSEQTAAALGRPDLRPRLSEVRVPAAIIGGSLDRLVTLEMQHEVAQRVPGAVHTAIPGVGHLPTLEAPREVAAALRTWLVKVEQACEDRQRGQ